MVKKEKDDRRVIKVVRPKKYKVGGREKKEQINARITSSHKENVIKKFGKISTALEYLGSASLTFSEWMDKEYFLNTNIALMAKKINPKVPVEKTMEMLFDCFVRKIKK